MPLLAVGLLFWVAPVPPIHVVEILLLRLDVELNGPSNRHYRCSVVFALLQPPRSGGLGSIHAVHFDAAAILLVRLP
jgi:hypothetical protein